jgi:hypothetical protein
MLRHSRAMVRHHRERKIKARRNTWWMKKVYDEAQGIRQNPYGNAVSYGAPWTHEGYLNKLSMHHHRCDYCVQKYDRPPPENWRKYLDA